MTESGIANTAQHEYWNNVAGPRWVGLGGFVERRVRAVNDLLLRRSAVMPGESVLEIGCGTGAALRHLGPPVPTPPRMPGPLAFSDRDYVRGILEITGLADIEISRETPDIISSTPEEEAEHACIMGPSARLIDEKKPGDAVRATIRREITEALAAYAGDKEMRLPSTIFLVTARRLS